MRTTHNLVIKFALHAALVFAPNWVLAEDRGTLPAEIARLVTANSPGRMRVGVRVEALGADPGVVYEYHSNDPLKPASNQKIITTAAAMSLLPANFCFRTILAKRGHDPIIIGAGDPSIGDPRLAKAAKEPITAVFQRWADRLTAAGVTSIAGDLLFDDTLFEPEQINPSWRGAFNLQEWYTAPVGGLNFNDNCIDVLCRPAAKHGVPASVTLIPSTPWVRLQNNTKTAAKGEPSIVRSGDGPLTVTVSGPVSRAGSADDPFSLTIIDSGAFFASTCRTVLASKGITIAGQTKRQRVRTANQGVPKDIQIIATHESRIGDFLWRVNKSSQNMFAEALFKTVGLYAPPGDAPVNNAPPIGSNKTGRAALERFIASLGVPVDGMVFMDGSGLSHENRTSAAAMVVALRHMDQHAQAELYRSSLAVPGEQAGTLRRRMKDLEGKVFAKTGTIRGVSSLSGYVLGPRGQRYAFSVLCNDTDRAKDGGGAARRLEDGLCRKLATWGGGKVQLGG